MTNLSTQPNAINAAATLLSEALGSLHRDTSLQYLKLGTEEESLDFMEIEALVKLQPEGIFSVAKIGGPCARGDIRQARRLGVGGIVGPMVESVYALQRFVAAVDAYFGSDEKIRRGINIETYKAFESLPDLLADPASKRLSFINIGRSDLAGSMGAKVGDPEVRDVVCSIVEQVRAAGIPIYIGGRVTSATLLPVLERVSIDGFHTRFLAFRGPVVDVDSVVRRALETEILLLQYLAALFPHRADEHLARVQETARRLG